MNAGRVLIIDDEPEFGELVRTVGEKLGHEVVVTTDANAFKDAYDRFDPTIIVLDIIMPRVDGIEILGWLSEKHCHAKILAITGANPTYGKFASALGDARGLEIENYTKPIKLAELRDALGGGKSGNSAA